jgi:hypothetical protein
MQSVSGYCYDFARFPRFKRRALEWFRVRLPRSVLASQMRVSQSLSHNLRQNHLETVKVSHRKFSVSAIVVTEFLFIQVTKQVEWLD